MGQGPLARRQSSDSQLSFQTALLPPLIKFAASAEKADSSPGKNAVRNDKLFKRVQRFSLEHPGSMYDWSFPRGRTKRGSQMLFCHAAEPAQTLCVRGALLVQRKNSIVTIHDIVAVARHFSG